MNKLFQIQNNNQNKYLFILIVIFVFNTSTILSQEISKSLDSIYNLAIAIEEKITLYHQLLSKHKKTENHTQLGSDAQQIGRWLRKNQNTKKLAIDFVKQAVEARKKATPFNPDLLKRSYNNLGLYYLRDQEYRNSIKTYKELVQIKETNYLIGRGYLKLGECYNILEDPYSAIDNLTKGFTYLEKDKKNLARNHIQIAKSYRLIRNEKYAEKGLNHLKKAEELLLNTPNNQRRLLLIYNDLGGWYLDILNDTINGEKQIRKALSIAEEIKDSKSIPKILYNLGLTKINRNEEAAKKLFSLSLEKTKGNKYNIGVAYSGLGLIENSIGNFAKAEKFYFKSLSSFLNMEISYDNALSKLTKKKLSFTEDPMFILEVFKKIIDNYIDWGIQKKETSYYQKAIDLVKVSDILIGIILESTNSDNSKLLWRSIASGTYASGIQASFEADDVEYGFFLSEKNKALLLQQDILKENGVISSELVEHENSLLRELTGLRKELELSNINTDSITESILLDKQEKLYHLRDSIKTLYPDYIKERQSSALLIPLSDIVIKDNEIVIQYMMTERIGTVFPNTYCLVLSKDAKKLFKLENTEDLHTKIHDLRALLNKPFRNQEDIVSFKKKATTLYHSLFPEEVRSLLKNKKITIVPDYLLSNLPFEALITDTGNYLLEQNEISYTYSLSFQKQNTERKRIATQEFLGIAPKDFKNDLTSLPNSIQEIESGIHQYSGKLLQNEEATKDNFIKEIKDYKIVHLATHAFASDSITPWISFKNEKITNAEIDLLRNNADMVVLSACNTSLGEVHSGEGVLSLARSFFRSGANTVIPSLWSTNDKATATITADFYKNLSEGQTKSAALRTAKLNYLHNNTDAEASPHYWASMILIGDTGTLLPQSNNLWMFLLGFGVAALIILCASVYKRFK
ncbi:hypothetical protein GCM10009430_47020 [Aquimarina litoralis]|uniref:CHAT domain-containing protein n=1 Tax=Aquimarina litoralis TaxID=584605 RepID=A0ABN1J9N5_9FLAO